MFSRKPCGDFLIYVIFVPTFSPNLDTPFILNKFAFIAFILPVNSF